jgi:hypothetical protein
MSGTLFAVPVCVCVCVCVCVPSNCVTAWLWTEFRVENILTIKPTRCTNFSNLFLEQNSTCFGQFLCPSSGVFHCTHSNDICHTGLLTACERDQDVPSWSCSQALSKLVWHIPLLCVQWKTPDDRQGNCPKHEEFYSKNKIEKSVHLVGTGVLILLSSSQQTCMTYTIAVCTVKNSWW